VTSTSHGERPLGLSSVVSSKVNHWSPLEAARGLILSASLGQSEAACSRLLYLVADPC
jgi:hypothetical protein